MIIPGNWNQWVDDFTPPLQPNPAPPDTLYPSDSLRFSNLPMDSIVSKIESSGLNLYPFIDYNLGVGNYLSEFLGYYGTLYNDLFNYGINNINSKCFLSGHIYLGNLIPWEAAKEAAKISFREVITSINLTLPLVGEINLDGSFSILDFFLLLSALIGDFNLSDVEKQVADIKNDSEVDIFDLILISDSLLQS